MPAFLLARAGRRLTSNPRAPVCLCLSACACLPTPLRPALPRPQPSLRSEDGPETDIKGEGQSQWHMMTKAFELSGFLQLDSGELSLEKAQLKVRVAYSGELRDDDFSGQKRITATCMGGGELSLTRTR